MLYIKVILHVNEKINYINSQKNHIFYIILTKLGEKMEKNSKKNQFFFQEYDIFIDFHKKINKREKFFLEFLIEKIKNNFENPNEKTLVFEIEVLFKVLNITEKEEFERFMNSFSEKRIIYKCKKFNLLTFEGSLYPVASFEFNDEKFYIDISEKFYSIFSAEENNFKELYFDILLQFDSMIVKKLFLFLINNKSINDTLEVSEEYLKEYLELSNTYDRFYDFEKNVLKKSIAQIEKYTPLKIKYEKIKNKSYLNSKIVGIKFYIIDNVRSNLSKQTNELLKGYEDLFVKYNKIWDYTLSVLSKKGYEYVKKNISYTILHRKDNMDRYIVEALKYNHYDNRLKNRVAKFSETHKLVFDEEKHYASLADLHTEFFKIIANLNLFYLTQVDTFYRELYKLKKYNELEYIDNQIAVFIEYNGEYQSRMFVFEK